MVGGHVSLLRNRRLLEIAVSRLLCIRGYLNVLKSPASSKADGSWPLPSQ